MNREDSIRMAREIATQASKVGPYRTWTHEIAMIRIMELIDTSAAAEREACAKVVLDDAWALTFQTFGQYRTALAAAIRARSNT